ncbi:MAG TPA: hypothetical protein PLW25_07150, partial [Anaerolineaceae bacterium]|nr:hypothetical protein [Anaerolineaceae bacterium]
AGLMCSARWWINWKNLPEVQPSKKAEKGSLPFLMDTSQPPDRCVSTGGVFYAEKAFFFYPFAN